MSADLTVDTDGLRNAADRLDEAASLFRRVEADWSGRSLSAADLGTGGAAIEVAAALDRRLQQGMECGDLLSERSGRQADALRETAAYFDLAETELSGGPR